MTKHQLFYSLSVIPSLADKAADRANIAAIDARVSPACYPYIVAWGKWLGFTPEIVSTFVAEAAADKAPRDAIQKIRGRWLRVKDICNDRNRETVKAAAAAGAAWKR